MDTEQIQSTLVKLYHEEGHRIVFWYDSDAEFFQVHPTQAYFLPVPIIAGLQDLNMYLTLDL